MGGTNLTRGDISEAVDTRQDQDRLNPEIHGADDVRPELVTEHDHALAIRPAQATNRGREHLRVRFPEPCKAVDSGGITEQENRLEHGRHSAGGHAEDAAGTRVNEIRVGKNEPRFHAAFDAAQNNRRNIVHGFQEWIATLISHDDDLRILVVRGDNDATGIRDVVGGILSAQDDTAASPKSFGAEVIAQKHAGGQDAIEVQLESGAAVAMDDRHRRPRSVVGEQQVLLASSFS